MTPLMTPAPVTAEAGTERKRPLWSCRKSFPRPHPLQTQHRPRAHRKLRRRPQRHLQYQLEYHRQKRRRQRRRPLRHHRRQALLRKPHQHQRHQHRRCQLQCLLQLQLQRSAPPRPWRCLGRCHPSHRALRGQSRRVQSRGEPVKGIQRKARLLRIFNVLPVPRPLRCH